MGSSSTTTQNNKPYAAAEPLIQEGLADAKSMYDAGGFNITPYQGDLVADRTAFQQAADAGTPGAVYGAMGGASAGMGALQRAMDPTQRSGAWDQVRQNVIADIMPSINASFAGSGMTGSTLHQQNLAKGLSAGLAGAEVDAWQQGENRALQAAGMIPGMNNAAFGALDYLRGVGADQQGQNQAEIQAAAFQDQQAKTADLNALQDYLALSTGAGGQFGVQSSRTKQSMGPLGLLGFGMQALPFF